MEKANHTDREPPNVAAAIYENLLPYLTGGCYEKSPNDPSNSNGRVSRFVCCSMKRVTATLIRRLAVGKHSRRRAVTNSYTILLFSKHTHAKRIY